MALNLAAIFGGDAVRLTLSNNLEREQPTPVERLTGAGRVIRLASGTLAGRPIVEGTEHFSLYVDDDSGHWPEFIPGCHYDIRQPSRLKMLCSTAGGADQ
jgi:hypothetical protein